MRIIETYIIWIKEEIIFAKLHKVKAESGGYLYMVETKTDIYEVSHQFVLDKNWII